MKEFVALVYLSLKYEIMKLFCSLLQENLDCPELIEAFEQGRSKASKKPEKRKTVGGTPGEPKAKRKEGDRPRGFDRNLDPERIIGRIGIVFVSMQPFCTIFPLPPADDNPGTGRSP